MTQKARRIYVPARGQYDNIGDILLRRQLLDWLRDSGPLHVYVGHSDPGYDEGLRLQDGDVIYRSLLRWYLAALRSAVRGRASYVFKPGEIQLTLVGMKEHVVMLPLAVLVRLTGGVVARVGVGSRNFARLPRAIMTPSILLSSVSLWRDADTARFLRHGSVMPDLGFGEGGDQGADLAEGRMRQDGEESSRDVLVVSMREDDAHPHPPTAAWIDAVRGFADDHALQIWTVTQVRRDDDRAAELAAALGGRALRWDGSGHDAQEERLRALYRRSAAAVSDRLHVLVAAVTEGAVPIAALTGSSTKIARHFAVAGVYDISVDSSGLVAREVQARMNEILARRDTILMRAEGARAQLERARERVGAVLAGR